MMHGCSQLGNEWNNRDVVVTGVTSPLGRAVARQLHGSGARVHAWNRTLPTDTSVFESCTGIDFTTSSPVVAEGFTPHAIFHLAAPDGDRVTVVENPLSSLSSLMIDLNVLAAALAWRPEVFVYASSATVYPVTRLPTQDDASKWKNDRYLVGPPFDPDTLFGWMKLTSEQVLEQVELSGAFRCIPARLFTLYDGVTSDYGVIGKWLNRAINGDELAVIGGSQLRTFTHVADAASGLIAAAEHRDQFSGGLDIASNETMSIARAADIVAEIFGTTSRVLEHGPHASPARDQIADFGLLQSWGWRAEHTLVETVSDALRIRN